MTPHLVKWQDKYEDRGFRVIEIDNGQRDSLAELQEHVEEAGIPFSILHDEGGEVCRRYRVRDYPTAYLLDRDRKVIWKGHPSDHEQLERLIESAL